VPLGRTGAGMIHRILWRVGGTGALDFWQRRLGEHGYEAELAGASLRFKDFEGLEHELMVVETSDDPLIAHHPEIPAELALHGFHAVRAFAQDRERSRGLLEETLGFEKVDGTAWNGRGGADRSEGPTWEARGDNRGGYY